MKNKVGDDHCFFYVKNIQIRHQKKSNSDTLNIPICIRFYEKKDSSAIAVYKINFHLCKYNVGFKIALLFQL